jgi:UDP-glucose 4-epimerase
MNILVTGGAGFIGSHIVDALIERGHSVFIYDDLSSGKSSNINPQATFIEGSITDEASLHALFAKHTFGAIFHLAAQINVRKSTEDPLFDAKTNILASLNLVDLASKNGVVKFIFSSTGGVMYGDTDVRPTPESHNEKPLSPYGIAKLSIDKYLAFYKTASPIKTISLRYGNVYGPRQNPHGEAGVVAIFLNKMLGEEQPVINGDGTQSRDYIYVGDVVRANIAALETETASGIYNIGTGIETSVNEIFSTLNSFFGNAFQEIHAPTIPGEQKTSSLDATRAHTELNWQPTMSLADGLKLTFKWFKK